MSRMTQKRSGFLLNSKMLYIICLLGMISAISFVRVGSSYAATEDNDRTDFGLLMPAKEVVETTLVDILKNQTALGITRWVAGDGELWCLVTDGRKFFSGRWLPSRRLLFYKKAGDKLILNYEYETMDRFSSCYVMEESGGRLLTVWDSGGTHHIVIFAVVEKTLKVVLMTGSKAFPEIADLDNDGVAEILIWGRSYEVGTSAEGNIQGYKWQSAYIYKWDGSSYTMVRTVPWQTRLNALQKTSP